MAIVIGGTPVLITLRFRHKKARLGTVPPHRIYYHATSGLGSKDTADPTKTTRVLIIMLAEELLTEPQLRTTLTHPPPPKPRTRTDDFRPGAPRQPVSWDNVTLLSK